MLDLRPPVISFKTSKGATWKFVLDIMQIASQTLLNLAGKKIVARITQNGIVLDTLTIGRGITLSSSNTAMVIQKDWTNLVIANNTATFTPDFEGCPVGQTQMQIIVSDSSGIDSFIVTYNILVTDEQDGNDSSLNYLVSRVEVNTNGFGVTTNVLSVVDLLESIGNNYQNTIEDVNQIRSLEIINKNKIAENTEYFELIYNSIVNERISGYISTKTGNVGQSLSGNVFSYVDYIAVIPGEKIYYTGGCVGTHVSAALPSGLAGYSQNKTFLSTLDSNGIPIGAIWDNHRYALANNIDPLNSAVSDLRVYNKQEVTIPDGCFFIRASGCNRYGTTIVSANIDMFRTETIVISSVKEEIETIYNEIEDINQASEEIINRTEYPITEFQQPTYNILDENMYVSNRNGISYTTTSSNQYRRSDFIAVIPGETVYFSGYVQGTSQGNTPNTGLCGYSGNTEASFVATLDSLGIPVGNLWDNTRLAIAEGNDPQTYQGPIPKQHTRVPVLIPQGINYVRVSGAILYNNVTKNSPKLEKLVKIGFELVKQRIATIESNQNSNISRILNLETGFATTSSRLNSIETKEKKAQPWSAQINAIRVGTEPSNKGFSVISNRILRKLRTFTIEMFVAGSFDVAKQDFGSTGSFFFNKNAFQFTGIGTIGRTYSDTIFRLIHCVCRRKSIEIWENRKLVATLTRTDALDILLNQADSTNANTFRAFLYHSGLNYAEYSQIRVYNYDLSESEIIEAYNVGKPLEYSPSFAKKCPQLGQNGLLFDSISSDLQTILVSSTLTKTNYSSAFELVNTPTSETDAIVTIPHAILSRKSNIRLCFDYTVNSGTCILKTIHSDVSNTVINQTLTGSGTFAIDFVGLYTDKTILVLNATNSFSITINKIYVQQAIIQAEYLPKNIDISNLTWKDSSENSFNLTATVNVNEAYIKRDLISTSSSKLSNNLRTRSEIISHRGLVLNGVAPEDSLDAYALSARCGFKFVETDVTDTLDGKFVLMHDLSINRTCRNASDYSTIPNTINVKDYSRDTLRASYVLAADEPRMRRPIPTLEEFLNTCKYYNLFPYMEIKLSSTFSNTRIADMWGICRDILGDGNFAIGCFDYARLQYIRTLSQKTHLVWFNSTAAYTDSNADIPLITSLGLPAYSSRDRLYATENFAKIAKQAGQEVSTWTAGTAEFDKLMKMGIERIITDWIAPNLDKQTVLFSDYTDSTFLSWKNEGVLLNGIVTLQAGQKLTFSRSDLQYLYLGGIYGNFEIQGSCTISANNTTLPISNTTGVFDNYFIQSMFAKSTPFVTITATTTTQIKDCRITIAEF